MWIPAIQSADLLVENTIGNNKVIEARRAIESEPARFVKDLENARLMDVFRLSGAVNARSDAKGNIIILREGLDHARLVVLVAHHPSSSPLLSKGSAAYSLFRLMESGKIQTRADVAFILEAGQAGDAVSAIASMPHERKSVVVLDDMKAGALGHRAPGLRTLLLKPPDPDACPAVREAIARAAAETKRVKVLPGSGCTVEMEISIGPNDLMASAIEALEAVDTAVTAAGVDREITLDSSPRRVSVGSDPVQVGTAVFRGLGIEPSYVPVNSAYDEMLRANNSFVALGYDGTNPADYGRTVLSLMNTVLSLSGLR